MAGAVFEDGVEEVRGLCRGSYCGPQAQDVDGSWIGTPQSMSELVTQQKI